MRRKIGQDPAHKVELQLFVEFVLAEFDALANEL